VTAMGGRGDREIDALEARLGHAFADRGLLVKALTHASAADVSDVSRDSYQRLEFLGDRVLAITIAAMLYDAFPAADEGELARRFNQLVRRETCAEVAVELGIDRAVRMGAGEAQAGGRKKAAILGDACEAVLAAVHLDGGPAAAAALVERLWGPRMLTTSGPLRDAKTTLQEWAQGRGEPPPVYTAAGRSGPDHAPEFRVAVALAGREPAEGRGRTKREAEQNAATALLVREGIWTAAEVAP